MAQALSLARLNHGLTGVNPSVGCCIVDAEGNIIGEGVTGIGGRPHAEQIALEMAGNAAKGSTAYVTLAPCGQRHTDDTPCSVRLIDAGIVRVVCAIDDPHPTGAGGLAALRQAGLQVRLGIKRNIAARLYSKFFDSVESKKQT